METTELPLKAKPVERWTPFLYLGISGFYLLPLLNEKDSHYFLFDLAVCIIWLTNAVSSLAALADQKIQFTEDAAVISRRVGKSLRLPYAAYRKTDGDLIKFAGYTLNLDLYQRKEEIAAVFRQLGEDGLLPWKETAKPKEKKVGAIILVIACIVVWIAVTGYFALILHNMRPVGIAMLAFAVIALAVQIARAIGRYRLNIRHNKQAH